MTADRALLLERVGRAADALPALVASVRMLDDDALREPSALPGWSRGHVVTHVARNADGLTNLAHWARTGDVRPMYLSIQTRSEQIDAGATRTAAEQVDDLLASGERFEAAWRQVADLDGDEMAAALARPMHLGPPVPHAPGITGALVPLARRREVEIHHTDLRLAGYPAAGWPTDFVVELLDTVCPSRSVAEGLAGVGRLAAEDGRSWSLAEEPVGITLTGPAWALAAWVVGRATETGVLRVQDQTDDPGMVPEPPAWV